MLIDKKIAFLGDSITEGAGVSKIENVFWKRVAERTGAKAYGYGVGGTRIAPQHNPDSNAIMGQFFGSRVTGMIPDADVVVVFGGTNDFGHGDAPFGDVSSRDETTFCGALHKLIWDLIERYPQAQLILMTPLHRSSENELGFRCPQGSSIGGLCKCYPNDCRLLWDSGFGLVPYQWIAAGGTDPERVLYAGRPASK